MGDVEWNDIQGLVRSGYGNLKESAYLLWRFKPDRDQQQAERWIRDLADRLTCANSDDPARARAAVRAINLALTASGLAALGVTEQERAYFSSEFREGMAPKPEPGDVIPRRTNLLGDLENNSPKYWEWGGWKRHHHIDGLLMLFAKDEDLLASLIRHERAEMDPVAELILTPLEGRFESKEHFGFTDGLSNPILEGTRRFNEANESEQRISVVKPGEFILGYENERNDCISHGGHSGSRDLGRNGTYLVFRQLQQDVAAFRKFVKDTATSCGESEERVAARMVGRGYDGEPLISGPAGAAAMPRKPDQPRNDFLYHFEDRFGIACPLGAHIRRANPRDTIGPDPDTALRLSKMHRIMRRGRIYGDRLKAADPPADDGTKRGLYFICLNANIAGQFEFIQHSWLNNRHFNRLYDEVDALGHVHARAMTVQDRPTNVRFEHLPQFITVKGGAYFFMPGINALRALGGRADELRSVA